MANKYLDKLEQYKTNNQEYFADVNDVFVELSFEKLYNNESSATLSDIIAWYDDEVKNCTMHVERMPLLECKGWRLDEEQGSIVHHSGEFFRVDGIRVTDSTDREVSGGWEQPILTQIGYDGGILGLIRKRINDVPHYLVEAKAEPGNPNIVQISPTVQATFSNIKRAHGGKATPFVQYFMNPEDNNATVIFDRWMSEDGGRLFNKRNKSMIVEVDVLNVPATTRYKWLTLNQLVRLTRDVDAIVAPHIRGILSVI
ncbi:NDP-hexose 2,3-dehydratase family protein [Pseudaeromonas paramecii]|uniref:dTDP-4-dehydro-6-deoxy-alpha-D-glucopyranose 2,3-dehydratase domain-containing protein n=1 Tax=Pseudaeromonas paramecii TaxID=2138166 RepID=A0ABP8Q4B9_9GAMM